jgi:uncharacterized iron-regulated membrane protein
MPVMQTALVQWTREIHTGTLFGLASKILASLCALLLTVLALTGPLIWVNKQRAVAAGRKALQDRNRRHSVHTMAARGIAEP